MAPRALVTHALPGRTRIRIDEKRGDEAYFATVNQALADCPGVEGVETNDVTGSVLVHYACDDLPIWNYAATEGLFRVGGTPVPASVSLPVATNLYPRRNHVRNHPPMSILEARNWRPLIFLALVGIGIAQAVRGNIAFPALTAFWYALHLLPAPSGSKDIASSLAETVPPGRS
jgi:Heavy metal associated domain 2